MRSQVKMTDIETTNPLYDYNIERWNYYRASFLGGFDYRQQSLGMLRKYLFEEDAPGNQYANRLSYTASRQYDETHGRYIPFILVQKHTY